MSKMLIAAGYCSGSTPGIARQRSGATAPEAGDRVAEPLADADEVRHVADAHHRRDLRQPTAASPRAARDVPAQPMLTVSCAGRVSA